MEINQSFKILEPAGQLTQNEEPINQKVEAQPQYGDINQSFKILEPAGQQAQDDVQKPEGWGEWGKRNIARAATNLPQILDVPANITNKAFEGVMSMEDINKLDIPEAFKQRMREARGPDMKIPTVTEQVQKALPEKWKEPRGKWEKFLDDTVASVPLFATLGGPAASLATNVGIGAAGRLVGMKLGENGYSKPIQVAGDMLTQWSLWSLAGMKPSNILNKAAKSQKAAYKDAYKIGSRKILPEEGVKQFDNKLNELAEKYGKYDTSSSKTSFMKNLGVIESDLVGDKIPVTRLMKIKREMNDLAYRSDVPRTFQKEYKGIAGAAKDVLKDYAKTDATFNKSYFGGAEEITKSINTFKDAVRDVGENSLFADVIKRVGHKGTLRALKKSPEDILRFFVGDNAKYIGPYMKYGIRNKLDMTKLLFDSVMHSLTENVAGPVSALSRTDQ